MENCYLIVHKGKNLLYSEERFKKLEKAFKGYGRAIYRIFCSRVNVIKKSKVNNLECIVK